MVAIDASPDSELRHFVDDVMMNIGYSLTEKLLLVREPVEYRQTQRGLYQSQLMCLSLTGHWWTSPKVPDEPFGRCAV
jgi:hypothetical protein